MQATTAKNKNPVLVAPERIIAATRAEFRGMALDFLESVPKGAQALVIDLSDTVELDASGLGILVLIQKRAKERARQEKRKLKEERRASAKIQKAANPRHAQGEDPDIAGITPGPQPNPWGDDD